MSFLVQYSQRAKALNLRLYIENLVAHHLPPHFSPPNPVKSSQHPNLQPVALVNIPVAPLYNPGAALALPPQYPILPPQGTMSGLLNMFQFKEPPDMHAAVGEIDASFDALHTAFPQASFGAIVSVTPHTPAGVRRPPGPCSVLSCRVFHGYRQF